MDENNTPQVIDETKQTGEIHQTMEKSSKKMPRKKRKLVIVALIVIVGLAVAALAVLQRDSNSGTSIISEAPNQADISITSTLATPASLAVSKGTQVTWTNNDTAQHQIMSDTIEGFDNTVLLEPGESYSFIFETPGTYMYYDQINPQQIQGAIVVK